jgi:nucleoside-diphosphate-sugar epimerase
MMPKPRVLLTGANGFVGRQVLARLPDTVEIHCVSRGSRTADENVTWHTVDLLDPAACAELISSARPTHLAHLAWNTEHGKFWTAPDNAQWRDTGIALVRAFAQLGGKRLLISGTGAEYASSDPSPLDESGSSAEAETLYGQMKNALRIEAQTIADEYGVSCSWARIFNVYGAFEDRGRFVPSIIGAILQNEPAKCSSGQQVRDFMDVRDLGSALVALALSDVQGPINLGSGQQAKIAEVAETIGRLMGRPDLIAPGALPDRPGEPLVQVPGLTRMRDELGFAPQIGLEQGLQDAIGWWTGAADEVGSPGSERNRSKQLDLADCNHDHR